jgi:ABC-type iron transport system FetAB ATPase subunit
MLEVKNLRVEFTGKQIINNCNYTFKQNKFYVIFGKSGSGKSTLLKTFTNLIPFKGNIFLENKDIMQISPQYLRKKIHYLHQEPVLFEGNVEENLKLPFTLKNNSDLKFDIKKAIRILKDMDLSKDILKQKVHKLSGGEKQRICLARAILLQPNYLLLDEPSSALDMSNEMQIIDIIKKISENITVIAVSHSAKIILNAEIKILMEDTTLYQINENLTYDKIYEIVDNEQSHS